MSTAAGAFSGRGSASAISKTAWAAGACSCRDLGGQLALPQSLVHCEIPHPSTYGFRLVPWRARVREELA